MARNEHGLDDSTPLTLPFAAQNSYRYTIFLVPVPPFSPLPLSRRPEPFSHTDWLFEVKYDGFRALAHLDPSGVRLVSRNGNRFASFTDLCASLEMFLKAKHAVLDGEIVCLDENGHSRFNELLFRRQQLIARKHTPGVARHELQEPELARRDRDFLVADPQDHGHGVNFQVADLQHRGGRRRLRAAKYRPYACHQLPWAERLGDVIIGSHIQTSYSVHFRGFGGHEHDGRPGQEEVAADLQAQFKSISPRKHNVENEKPRQILRGFLHNRGTASEYAGTVGIELQLVLHQACNVRIIFHHIN